MMIPNSQNTRRLWLQRATGALALIAGVMGTIPFVRSMSPSARSRALGGPTVVDVAQLDSRRQLTAIWRGKPIWVLYRNPEMLRDLNNQNLLSELTDPDSKVADQQPVYARNAHRSIQPQFLVAVGLCTHLGCVPSLRAKGEMPSEPNWPGGYFCPCHGSKFDFAGRVYKNVPAPTNLVVPPYRYISDTIIEIGTDTTIEA